MNNIFIKKHVVAQIKNQANNQPAQTPGLQNCPSALSCYKGQATSVIAEQNNRPEFLYRESLWSMLI